MGRRGAWVGREFPSARADTDGLNGRYISIWNSELSGCHDPMLLKIQIKNLLPLFTSGLIELFSDNFASSVSLPTERTGTSCSPDYCNSL